jgi:hypothetical protein
MWMQKYCFSLICTSARLSESVSFPSFFVKPRNINDFHYLVRGTRDSIKADTVHIDGQVRERIHFELQIEAAGTQITMVDVQKRTVDAQISEIERSTMPRTDRP